MFPNSPSGKIRIFSTLLNRAAIQSEPKCSWAIRRKDLSLYEIPSFLRLCFSSTDGLIPNGYPSNSFLAPSRTGFVVTPTFDGEAARDQPRAFRIYPETLHSKNKSIFRAMESRSDSPSIQNALDFPFQANLAADYFHQASVTPRPKHSPTPAARSPAEPAANRTPGQSILSKAAGIKRGCDGPP